MNDLKATITELLDWPGPQRYAAAGRPPILLLQYALWTGGSCHFVQRLADGLADLFTCDVTGFLGSVGSAATAIRSARVLPHDRAGLLRHAHYTPYAYLDTPVPVTHDQCELIELLLAARPGIKLGIRFHCEAPHLAYYLRADIQPRVEALLRRADCLYFYHTPMCDEISALFAGLPDERCFVCQPGIDVERFRPGGTDDGAVAEYARRFGLVRADGSNRLVVAMAARASREKNWLDYLMICRRLKDTWGDDLVCLAITGPDRGRAASDVLRELADFNSKLGAPARVTGFLHDYENLLASVDVYVQTSCSESFCRTAAEAEACGAPVVATAVGGLKHCVVRHDLTGYLVTPEQGHGWYARLTQRDRTEFYGRIHNLLASTIHRQQFGGSADVWAYDHLDDRDNTTWHRVHLSRLLIGS